MLEDKKMECNEPMQIYHCYWERFLRMIATTIASIHLCVRTILCFVVLATVSYNLHIETLPCKILHHEHLRRRFWKLL